MCLSRVPHGDDELDAQEGRQVRCRSDEPIDHRHHDEVRVAGLHRPDPQGRVEGEGVVTHAGRGGVQGRRLFGEHRGDELLGVLAAAGEVGGLRRAEPSAGALARVGRQDSGPDEGVHPGRHATALDGDVGRLLERRGHLLGHPHGRLGEVAGPPHDRDALEIRPCGVRPTSALGPGEGHRGRAQQRVDEPGQPGLPPDHSPALGRLERRRVESPGGQGPRVVGELGVPGDGEDGEGLDVLRWQPREPPPGGRGPTRAERDRVRQRDRPRALSRREVADDLEQRHRVACTRRAQRRSDGGCDPVTGEEPCGLVRLEPPELGPRPAPGDRARPIARTRRVAARKDDRDGVAREPPEGEGHRVARELVDPLRIVDDDEHRLLLGGRREQREAGGPEGEGVGAVLGADAVEQCPGDGAGGVGQVVHVVVERAQEGQQRRQREVALALGAAHDEHRHPACGRDRVVTERRLPGARGPAQSEDAGARVAGRVEEAAHPPPLVLATLHAPRA